MTINRVLTAILLLIQGLATAGESFSISDVFPADGSHGHRFTLEHLDHSGGTLQPAAAAQVWASNDVMRVSADGYRIDFSVQSRDRYLVLRIIEVVEPVPDTLMTLSFKLSNGTPFELTRLDHMTVPVDNGRGMSWPWLWAKDTPNPRGAFAIHAPRDDASFDENLLRMWVQDGLPHPKVEGAWTLERARKWLTEWQARFSDQSCLVVGAKDRDELDTMTDWAEKIGMKRIYLHTDTWRGEYWPREYSYLRVNPEVFPRGEADLNQYTANLFEKGMSFAVHSTVISIAPNDPDYVRNGLHPDLARWVRGTLEKDAGAGDDTLYFRPAPGSKYPRQKRLERAGPDTLPSFMSLRQFRLGDELVDAGVVEKTDEEVWELKQCRRGDRGTSAAAHPAGTVLEGLTMGYGQAFMPDSDSQLFEETIRRWAEFCTRNDVDHLECDALEIHADHPWGPGKFSWLLSSHLTLPSTSNTSNGRPLPFQVEYWFRGSKKVVNNHPRSGAAGGASLPLYLHSDIRTATGPYEILFKPAQMIGGGGNSFNISYPWPMFGVTPEILRDHGMVPVVEQLIKDWRTVLNDITPGQREVMAGEYGPFRGPSVPRGQPATDVLFRPEVIDGERRIVPLRLAGRAAGELNWGFGQEFGPVVPRQYLRAGETLQLENPWQEQEPEFVIRVKGRLEDAVEAARAPEELKSDQPETLQASAVKGNAVPEDMQINQPGARRASAAQTEKKSGGSDQGSKKDGAILDAYAAGTTTDFTAHPLHTARHVWPAAGVENDEAKAGTVELRHVFKVTDPAAVKRARLYVQVDDEATAFINGTKVFSGGRYDQALFVDVTNLRKGRNKLVIKADNMGGPGSLAAALHLHDGDTPRILASDSTWQGKAEGGNWGPVTELVAYGAGAWPRAQPESGALRLDLMPHNAAIEPGENHELTLDDDTLEIACRNDSNETAVHVEDRPAWATSIDMSNARGLGCTVTGDGSGAVLVITIEGRGARDYAIPIDFKGTREIEIPSGEVAWGDPNWGWRFHSARFDYSRIRGVQVGFGTVPAKTEAKVTVKEIRPLRQVPVDLQDVAIKVGGGELVVPGTVPRDHYLWYRGGDTVELYDLNWNKVKNLAVRKKDFVVPAGPFTVELTGAAAQKPWVECQFFIKGEPMVVGE